MTTLYLYLATLAVFVAFNLIALRLFLLPLFEQQMGNELLSTPRVAPAVAFYLLYPAGILYFASYPALRNDVSLGQIFLEGALFGMLAYGTYEATNYATLRRWSSRMMMLDVSWGATLTGLSAAVGAWLATFPSAA